MWQHFAASREKWSGGRKRSARQETAADVSVDEVQHRWHRLADSREFSLSALSSHLTMSEGKNTDNRVTRTMVVAPAISRGGSRQSLLYSLCPAIPPSTVPIHVEMPWRAQGSRLLRMNVEKCVRQKSEDAAAWTAHRRRTAAFPLSEAPAPCPAQHEILDAFCRDWNAGCVLVPLPGAGTRNHRALRAFVVWQCARLQTYHGEEVVQVDPDHPCGKPQRAHEPAKRADTRNCIPPPSQSRRSPRGLSAHPTEYTRRAPARTR